MYTSPLTWPYNLVIPIPDDRERWVGAAFGGYKYDLVSRAVQRYVSATYEWTGNKDEHALSQERRLAFIDVLLTVSAACEELAGTVGKSYEEHATVCPDKQ